VLPHQVEAEQIALGSQPELKAHVSNVQRSLQRILRDGGDKAEVAKRAMEMLIASVSSYISGTARRSIVKLAVRTAVASSYRSTSTKWT
jgi:hypothetical protein